MPSSVSSRRANVAGAGSRTSIEENTGWPSSACPSAFPSVSPWADRAARDAHSSRSGTNAAKRVQLAPGFRRPQTAGAATRTSRIRAPVRFCHARKIEAPSSRVSTKVRSHAWWLACRRPKFATTTTSLDRSAVSPACSKFGRRFSSWWNQICRYRARTFATSTIVPGGAPSGASRFSRSLSLGSSIVTPCAISTNEPYKVRMIESPTKRKVRFASFLRASSIVGGVRAEQFSWSTHGALGAARAQNGWSQAESSGPLAKNVGGVFASSDASSQRGIQRGRRQCPLQRDSDAPRKMPPLCAAHEPLYHWSRALTS
mmetsp:Transcript_3893/g.12088  ORF Transcript_3893/g.12088 Transcript_3893/m.12088 type:complete len:315 (+) Transcript_3893:177-1121(+)